MALNYNGRETSLSCFLETVGSFFVLFKHQKSPLVIILILLHSILKLGIHWNFERCFRKRFKKISGKQFKITPFLKHLQTVFKKITINLNFYWDYHNIVYLVRRYCKTHSPSECVIIFSAGKSSYFIKVEKTKYFF